MRSLLEDQRRFAAALLNGAHATSAGIAVYRGNVQGNWRDALANAYPIVRKIVGEGFFAGLARDYALAHPSTSGDLNEFGASLPEFVAAYAPTLDLPYLPDVARMEWLAHRAYYATDPAPFDFQALSALSHDAALRPVLAPACSLMSSDWPLARLWLIHQDDYEGEFAVDLAAGPDRILVHRPRWRAQVVSLMPGDYCFLQSAQAGATLGEALEAALVADASFSVSTVLARWVDAGVITRLHQA